MNRKRLFAMLMCVALFTAACGDDGGGGSDTGGGDDRGGGAAGSVTVTASWSGDEQAAFEKVLEAFTDETGIEATYSSTGDDTATILGTRIEGGDPPDVAMLPQPGLLRDLAARRALKPIEEVAGDLVDEHYAPVWRELGTIDGTLYGVWFKASNKSTFWYRTAAFEDAGVEPPETFDDLVDICGTLSDAGVTPLSLGGGQGWTLTDWFENVYLRTAGPEKYDELSRHEIPWTDQSVKDALQKLRDVWKPEWIAGGVEGALGASNDKAITTVFADEDAAMVYEGDFVAGVISSDTDAKVGEDAKFFTFPEVGSSGKPIVGGGDVAALLTDNEAGKELIKFLATPEAAEIWAGEGGFTSPNKSVDLDAYADDTGRQSASELVGAETFRFDLSDLVPAAFGATDGQGMWKLLQDFLRNPSAIDATASALEAAAVAADAGS